MRAERCKEQSYTYMLIVWDAAAIEHTPQKRRSSCSGLYFCYNHASMCKWDHKELPALIDQLPSNSNAIVANKCCKIVSNAKVLRPYKIRYVAVMVWPDRHEQKAGPPGQGIWGQNVARSRATLTCWSCGTPLRPNIRHKKDARHAAGCIFDATMRPSENMTTKTYFLL